MSLPLSLDEIHEIALKLGWDDVGVTEAKIQEKGILEYKKWLENNFHGDMAYMENQLRASPQELLPGAQSAIIFVSYYKQEKIDFPKEGGLIASYARGRDYHHVHRKRLKKFIQWLEERTGQQGIAKGFSDSTPIMEKPLAVQAGLGWFGKNTLLIHRKFGTFTLLSGVLTTLKLPHSVLDMFIPRCGACQRCIDACPTQAITSPYSLNAARCLSYHLIESKKEIPQEIKEKNPGYIFGCDICQDVCPHNARKKSSTTLDFSPDRGIGKTLQLSDIEELENTPEKLFGTPLQRRGVSGLRKTAESLSS